MTERLYYRDSFLREFDAAVLSCEPAGDQYQLLLDRTAFYPTSGGQPHDTGKIGDASVLEVVERDDMSVAHLVDRPVPAGPVHGIIDWERRFDHMQQHTGQHILSAAFLSLFRFQTVSFHLGRDVSTIDLDSRSVVTRHVEEAEERANQIVFEDRPVTVRWGTAQELADAGIRKNVEREGVLRAVEIEGCDLQPCGGTHVTRTGQVGLILLRKVEKQKQLWRVEFACGARALRTARGDYATLGEAARRFSCGLPDVPALVEKTLEEQQSRQRSQRQLVEQLAAHEAHSLLAPETVTGGGRTETQRSRAVIVHLYEDAEADFLRILAAKIVAEPGMQVLLATRAGGYVVFAQSPGGPADMGGLLRESLATVGGKGGGPRDFAQGKAPDPQSLDAALSYASQRLSS